MVIFWFEVEPEKDQKNNGIQLQNTGKQHEI